MRDEGERKRYKGKRCNVGKGEDWEVDSVAVGWEVGGKEVREAGEIKEEKQDNAAGVVGSEREA